MAWERVAGNRGARTAGVDAVTRRHVDEDIGVLPFLEELRSSLRDGSFRALPVRQVMIPKAGGKLRELGIPTVRDRVAQMALKLVLEPIFEADFLPVSYGFRPEAARPRRDRRDPPLTSRCYRVGARGGHHGLLGCIITLLLRLIVVIKTGRLGVLGAGCADPFCVRCGRARLGVRHA